MGKTPKILMKYKIGASRLRTDWLSPFLGSASYHPSDYNVFTRKGLLLDVTVKIHDCCGHPSQCMGFSEIYSPFTCLGPRQRSPYDMIHIKSPRLSLSTLSCP